MRDRRAARLTGSGGGEEGDWFRFVAQGALPGKIGGQVARRHAPEEPVDGAFQDRVMTVDPPEGQSAGAAPGQAAGFLFGVGLTGSMVRCSLAVSSASFG